MIALVEMLVGPAQAAEILVPADTEDYDPNKFPHFHVFARAQIGAPMPDAGAPWDNAKVVAAIPENHIRKVTSGQLQARGFRVGRS